MEDTIFEVLKAEHDEVKPVMKELTEEFDRAAFNSVAGSLHKHMEAEEHVLYERLKNEESTRDMVLEGYEEHRVAEDLLRKLQDQKPGTDLWMARMKVLTDVIEHHIDEEENELFPAAKGVVSDAEARELARKFESTSQRVPAHA